MRYRGLVVKRRIGIGSKSEHDAVKLVTEKREYVLRRRGGNPFSDPVLNTLVGKTIECDGIVHGRTLIMSDWRAT